MVWTIHTGPFPVSATTFDGDVWLWRITDGVHYTAVIVKVATAVRDADPTALSPQMRNAVATRGRTEVERTLRWYEPPREIACEEPTGASSYWAGVQWEPVTSEVRKPNAER